MDKTLLELFSGTGSIGRVAEVFGYDVISLDLKDAKIVTDILEWDYTKLAPLASFATPKRLMSFGHHPLVQSTV